jgi:hypothetical protein
MDGSGLGNHGILKANEGGSLAVQEPGVKGKALKFNGESAYGEIPGLLIKLPMTISAWIKPGSLTPSSTAGRQMILYASEAMGNDGYGPEPEIHFMRAAGNTFAFWANNAGRRLDLRHPIEGEDQWTHITIVLSETSKMYINGEEVSSMSGVTGFKVDEFVDRIYIGRPNVDYLRYFNGAIDELCFFNEALDEQDVKKLYQRK